MSDHESPFSSLYKVLEDRVYDTTDDERAARQIAEDLWHGRNRKAVVVSVNEYVRFGDPALINPGALRTTDRYAVIAEVKTENGRER